MIDTIEKKKKLYEKGSLVVRVVGHGPKFEALVCLCLQIRQGTPHVLFLANNTDKRFISFSPPIYLFSLYLAHASLTRVSSNLVLWAPAPKKNEHK